MYRSLFCLYLPLLAGCPQPPDDTSQDSDTDPLADSDSDQIVDTADTDTALDESDVFTSVSADLFGATDADERVGGMAMDAEGSLYFTANLTGVLDLTYSDLLIGKVDADGDLAWAKIWNGPFEDSCPDADPSGVLGGTSATISVDSDGNPYVIGAVSPNSSNYQQWSFIARLNPTNGSILWERGWSPLGEVTTYDGGSRFFAVDASGPMVLAAGSSRDDAQMTLVGFDPETGDVAFDRELDVALGQLDRAFAIRRDGLGGAYLAGSTAANGVIIHLDDVDIGAPDVDWSYRANIATGGRINALAVDDDGNAYATIDVDGSTDAFAWARFNLNGTVEWAKKYAGSVNANNNVDSIAVNGDDVWVGGRVGLANGDPVLGDGLLLISERTEGAVSAAGVYFTGSEHEQRVEHRIKGIAFGGGSASILAQSVSSTENTEH